MGKKIWNCNELLERELIRRTGRRDIEVSIGPYEHDATIEPDLDDGHLIVSFYESLPSRRFIIAFEYALDIITNWLFYEVERNAEIKALRPIFEQIQAKFTNIELEYFATSYDPSVVAERDEANRLKVGFDLWMGIKQKDIELIERRITEALELVREEPEASSVELKCSDGGNVV